MLISKDAIKRAPLMLAAAVIASLAAGCDRADPPTITPAPSPTPVSGTPTLTPDAVTKNRVHELFDSQVDAIQRGDWAAVYQTCSPSFRSGRTQEVFIRNSIRQLTLDGYTPEGFEARNVEPSIRAPDRVRVRWDAYQDGEYVRTEEVGQVYVLVLGRWYDEGAWCR